MRTNPIPSAPLFPAAVFSVAVLCAVSFSSKASGQELTDGDAGSSVAALRAALTVSAEAGDRVFGCSIEEVKPEATDGFGGGVVMRIGGGAASGGKPFEGKVDVWQSGREQVLTSRDVLPGVAIYAAGDRVISRSTVEGATIDLSKLQSDLLPLLDFAQIAKRLDRVSLKASTDEATGDTVYEGELPKKLVASGGSEMQMMQEVVLRVEGVFRVGPDGALKSAKFAVIRNDPMAAIRKQAMNGQFGGGGSVKVERTVHAGDMEEVSQEEGTMSVYEITVAGEPSARARRFKEEVHEILAAEEV